MTFEVAASSSPSTSSPPDAAKLQPHPADDARRLEDSMVERNRTASAATGWWQRRNDRLKLTVWYGAATLAVLSAYAAAVFAVVRHNSLKTLDERLRGDFQWAQEMVEQRPDGSFAWFEGDTEDGESPWMQVWND